MKIEFTKNIYISGPLSGYDYKERQESFTKVQKILELMNYEVKNPLANDSLYDPPKRLRENLKMLLDCDEIFMMDGWNKSQDCLLELNVAVAAGMQVLYETNSIPCTLITSIGSLSVVKTKY